MQIVLVERGHTGVWHGCWFPVQYFEYSSQKELRHNIGKQLCLQTSKQGDPVKLELCQRKGKGTSLAPTQEWIITEVRTVSLDKHPSELFVTLPLAQVVILRDWLVIN